MVHQIDPIRDPRWNRFLELHPRASVFHCPAWLEALRRTYGYDCIAYTTSPPGQDLQNGLVFCSVESWLTGRRLVSLPFSDHCEPLTQSEEDLHLISEALEQDSLKKKLRYVEIRSIEPIKTVTSLNGWTSTYSYHRLDLRPSLNHIFHDFHKDCIQRKIRRAEHDGLVYQEGSTEPLLDSFYGLLTTTRRRHGIPPQPKKWFANLASCFGEALKIRMALKGGYPVAAMLTLRYKDVLVYKYGASDARFHNLGSVHLLFWKAIQEAKNCGLRIFDLGRTDLGQRGLITFKGRWGAKQSILTYYRYGPSADCAHFFDAGSTDWKVRLAKHLFAHAHASILSIAGQLAYKHFG